MFEQFKFVVDGLVKKPLQMICGLLIAAVIYLWIEIAAFRKSDDAKGDFYRSAILKCAEEKIQMQQDFAKQVDSIREKELRKTEEQIRVLNEFLKQKKR